MNKPVRFGRAAFWWGGSSARGTPIKPPQDADRAAGGDYDSPKPQVSLKHSRSHRHLPSTCPDIFPLKSKFCSHFPIPQKIPQGILQSTKGMSK